MAAGGESGKQRKPDSTQAPAGQAGEARKWVWLARIRRPQGRKGELFAEILTDFPEKFAERKQLWLLRENPYAQTQGQPFALPQQVTLTNNWLHKGGVVLHFEGVNSISDAEPLAGLIVAISFEERALLAADETYIGDLIGCALIDVARQEPVIIGEIEGVDRSASEVPLLIVRGAEGRSSDEILIPFAKSYLRKIDVEARRVEMSLPVGLVDLKDAEEA
jgi:16S rRNA processing protein RimM